MADVSRDDVTPGMGSRRRESWNNRGPKTIRGRLEPHTGRGRESYVPGPVKSAAECPFKQKCYVP